MGTQRQPLKATSQNRKRTSQRSLQALKTKGKGKSKVKSVASVESSSKENSPVLSDSPLSSTLRDSPGLLSQEDASLATKDNDTGQTGSASTQAKEEDVRALRRQLEETERRLAESQRAVAQASAAARAAEARVHQVVTAQPLHPDPIVRPSRAGAGWRRAPIKTVLGLSASSALGVSASDNYRLTVARTTAYNWLQATARMAVLMCHQTKEKEKRFEWGEKTWSTCSGPQRDYMMKVFRNYVKSYEILRRIFYLPELGPLGAFRKFKGDWPMMVMLQVVLRNEKEQEERPQQYQATIHAYLANEVRGEPFIHDSRTIVRHDGTELSSREQSDLNRNTTHHDPDIDGNGEGSESD